MRNIKSIQKKAKKANARKKDFAKRRNIRQNNVPTPRYEVEEKDKTVTKKGFKKLLKPGVNLPQSRKYQLSKSKVKEQKKLLINTASDNTATTR